MSYLKRINDSQGKLVDKPEKEYEDYIEHLFTLSNIRDRLKRAVISQTDDSQIIDLSSIIDSLLLS